MPDSNDILYNSHSFDIVSIGRSLFDSTGTGDALPFGPLFEYLNTLWNTYTVLAFIFSFVLFVGIVYTYIRSNQLSDKEMEMIQAEERLYRELYGREGGNDRLTDIERHIESENPNDWKLAIIEADVMLGELLKEKGYAGSTIGDQLKSISPTVMQTLEDAWDAHKIRNQIAHSGPDFVLTKKLALETIVQYKRAFQELSA